MVSVEERNRLVNIIFLLANTLISSNFLMFHFAADQANRLTLNVQIISWAVYIAAVIAVNTWLYYVYYKKPPSQARSMSP